MLFVRVYPVNLTLATVNVIYAPHLKYCLKLHITSKHTIYTQEKPENCICGSPSTTHTHIFIIGNNYLGGCNGSRQVQRLR